MMRKVISGISGVVLVVSLILAMVTSKQWYMYPFLLGGYLLLWFYSPSVPAWRFTQLMIGEIATAAALQDSLMYGVGVQTAVVAIFLLQMNILVSKGEVVWFLVFFVLVTGGALMIDQSREILAPVILVLGACGIATLYVLLDEYRTVQMFRGDH